MVACLLAAGVMLHRSPVDGSLFRWIQASAGGWALPASALSVLGTGSAAVIMVALAGLRRPRALAQVLMAALLGGLLVQLIKASGWASAPMVELANPAAGMAMLPLHPRSMPSGHAAMWACLATLLCLWRDGIELRTWRLAAPPCAVLLAVAGGLARCAVGAHGPADVLVGSALGMATALLVAGSPAMQRLAAELASGMQGRSGSRMLAALLVALSASIWVAAHDGPLAQWLQALVAVLGLIAAWRWWRLHPGPLKHTWLHRRAAP
jgi:membrane-associated phospholipid phosphatase